MKTLTASVLGLLGCTFASGFAPKWSKFSLRSQQHQTTVRAALSRPSDEAGDTRNVWGTSISDNKPHPVVFDTGLILPAAILSTALPVEAAGVLPSALWAYAHYLSLLVITGCLVAERTLVKPAMSVEDEDAVVRLDVVYGLMAALLIISGFARAAKV